MSALIGKNNKQDRNKVGRCAVCTLACSTHVLSVPYVDNVNENIWYISLTT